MEYSFNALEKKWQEKWKADQAYRVTNNSSKPKCYVLDMFPYPSGTGLHVGHPLGYIASDIFARYKRLKGFNVLHPMGYDAFGLPAEQYAIDHGIHPAVSTKQNIRNFRDQLDRIGFSFDWNRQVNTAEPAYYKWTQWIFLQLFNSWYDRNANHARPIAELVSTFEKQGSMDLNTYRTIPSFSAAAWKTYSEKQQQDILMEFRLAYCGYGEVNWCEALGTVLANDEVINGFSERGGHPVVKKKLRQWYLRITDYADRLLEGLDTVAFSDAMKEMQTNWIGKSYGAEIDFEIAAAEKQPGHKLRVYTTRPDTIFGVDFMVVAPEHEFIPQLTTPAEKLAVDAYIAYVKSRSERERMAEKKITGCFTGSYVFNPFNGHKIPVWISEYVLAGYGTGAIMAVPCGDERDFKFARHFNIPVTNIIGKSFNGLEANPTKDARLENSGFLNGIPMRDAIPVVNARLEAMGIGNRRVNYKIRDAAFSRQRYWGEPFPITWKNGIAYPMDEKDLPLELPKVDSYKPGPDGEGPLANLPEWTSRHLETNTMPGYAGSSWYFLRYMDPHNTEVFCSRAASDYWGQVDLYIGGTEHAVGHLLYSRMWTKFLFDLGFIGFDEPFRRLVNQGMIQGSSRFVYRIEINGSDEMEVLAKQKPVFISAGLKNKPFPELQASILNTLKESWGAGAGHIQIQSVSSLHVDVNLVDGMELDIAAFTSWRPEYAQARFVLEQGKYICGSEVEKMSKSKFNTVNPNELVEKYGADTFRMYEMFLGPVEQSKPWDTKGIEGVHRFLRKLWRLFFDETRGRVWTTETASDAEWKVLHKAIKKLDEDTDRFSFNTAISACMITVNELGELKSHKKEVLEKLLIILTPYAPHICEELWHELGNESSILDADYPQYDEKFLIESAKLYPVAINGKTRTELKIALDANQQQVEEMVLTDSTVRKWLEGKSPKKVIYVKNKMINIVI
ncbi:MAG TPA: leucine--tRNA ligase [Chitinophagaceae bacterium]|nr:leucine--tRNA ligase [Chitinophagaceae bacterium]